MAGATEHVAIAARLIVKSVGGRLLRKSRRISMRVNDL